MKKRTWNVLMRALIFAIVLTVFPTISGALIVIYQIDTVQGYLLQGTFMIFSVLIPIIFMWNQKIKPSQIGFLRMEKGIGKEVLFFLPLVASKAGFLLCGVTNDLSTGIALLYFTLAIGISEEIYFRGLILRDFSICFSVKKTVLLSSVFFAAVHSAQAFSGSGILMVLLSILNAFIFGVVAAELVLKTRSIIPVITWHTLFDFMNWMSLAQGTLEIVLIVLQTIILIAYAAYLWISLPAKHNTVF